jgi:hypothetical protein
LKKRQKLSINWLGVSKETLNVLLIAAASRIFVVVIAVLCIKLFTTSNLNFYDLFVRSDSGFYLGLAQNGYPQGVPSEIAHTAAGTPVPDVIAYAQWAFFPLYPAVISTGAVLEPFLSTHNALVLMGYLISNFSFFVAVYFFYKISSKHFDKKVALASTVFFSFFVGGLYYSGVFSEALFMALSLGAFYFMEENKLVTAVFLGFLASFTRSIGFLIFIPFAVLAINHLLKRHNPEARKLFLAAVLVASPYLLWNIVGYFMTGVFPVHVIAHDSNWGMYPPLLSQFSGFYVAPIPPSVELFYVIGLAVMLIPMVYFITEVNTVFTVEAETLGYWAFYGGLLCMCIFFNATIFSILRYAVPLLPMYWVLAKIYTKKPVVGCIFLGIWLAMLVVGIYYFITGTYYVL